MPGSPATTPQNRGATDAVGQVLGQGFDGGAADGGGVEAVGVAADDQGHGAAALGEPAAQARRDRPAMCLHQAALGQQRAHQQALDEPARRNLARDPRRGRSGGDRRADDEAEQEHAGAALADGARLGPQQAALEPGDAQPISTTGCGIWR